MLLADPLDACEPLKNVDSIGNMTVRPIRSQRSRCGPARFQTRMARCLSSHCVKKLDVLEPLWRMRSDP